jgi:hypothetical protein
VHIGNAKTGLALRAKVDAALAQVAFELLKPYGRKLFFAMRANWYYFFFFLKSNHHMSPSQTTSEQNTVSNIIYSWNDRSLFT